MEHNTTSNTDHPPNHSNDKTEDHMTKWIHHTHRLQTHIQRVCVCVSWVVSRCFLAGVWRESTHGERGGHPDEAWRRKNEVWGEFGIMMLELSLPPSAACNDCWHNSNSFKQKKRSQSVLFNSCYSTVYTLNLHHLAPCRAPQVIKDDNSFILRAWGQDLEQTRFINHVQTE